MLTGMGAWAPFQAPVYLSAFLPSEVGLPHFFSKQLSGLWAIAVTRPTKKSSRGRLWVGFMN
jgi:hypothetical protein